MPAVPEDRPAAAPVAVGIVSWNTRDLLRRCLESVREDERAGRTETWVVDNASDDGSAEMVRDGFDWARLIEAGDNLGFGAAVHLVASRTSAPWLLVLNADSALTPGAVAALLRAGEQAPTAGALAPRLQLPDGSIQHSVHPFPTVAFTALFNLGLARIGPLGDRLMLEGRWDPSRPREVDWAIGAALLIRRAAWDEVGGFSDAHWMYAEDLDLAWRLRRAGWRTRYVPEALVEHESAASSRQRWEDPATEWSASTYAWMMRRRGAAITRGAALINVAGAGTRWAALSVLARIGGRRWAKRRDAMRRWVALHRIGLRPKKQLLRHR